LKETGLPDGNGSVRTCLTGRLIDVAVNRISLTFKSW